MTKQTDKNLDWTVRQGGNLLVYNFPDGTGYLYIERGFHGTIWQWGAGTYTEPLVFRDSHTEHRGVFTSAEAAQDDVLTWLDTLPIDNPLVKGCYSEQRK